MILLLFDLNRWKGNPESLVWQSDTFILYPIYLSGDFYSLEEFPIIDRGKVANKYCKILLITNNFLLLMLNLASDFPMQIGLYASNASFYQVFYL